MKKIQIISIALLVLVCLFLPEQAQAQMDPDSTISRIIHVFKDNASHWEGALQRIALQLFWALAGIEFTWSAIKLALRRDDLEEYLAELINRILFIGFFLTLLLHSSEWATAIINSFRMAAASASGIDFIKPSNIFSKALEIATSLLHDTSIFDPQDAIISSLCAISILLCFGFMAANLIEALLESYIVVSAGVIMMGLGGSSWTSEYAKKLLIYAISVGAKLFLLQLLMGMCEQIVNQLSHEFNGSDIQDAMVMVGVAGIMWIITLNIPNKLQGLINGTSFGSGGMIAGAVTAAAQAGVAAGVAAATGGFGAAAGATSLWKGASALTQAQNPEKPATFRAAAGNTIRAGFENAGERMRGEIRHGNPAMQMGHAMRQKAEKLNEQREAADTAPGGKAHYYSSVPADQKQYENMGANGSKNRIYPEED